MCFKVNVVLIVSISLTFVDSESRWPCTTPNGEDGECVTITACPAVMKAFANPKKGTESYLNKYKCLDDEPFIVCCDLSSNFTVFNNLNATQPTENTTKKLEALSDLRFCGLQRADDYYKLENDTTKTADEFPWLALIFIDKPTKFGYGCGTLINRRYVLTSTVFLPSFSNFQYYPVTVRLGDFNIQNETDCVKLPQFDEECTSYEAFRVEESIRHPFYVLSRGLHSLTLLRLDKNVFFSDYIRPICLPIPGIEGPKLEDTLHVSGWGLTDQRQVIFTKKKFLTTLISNKECTEAEAGNNFPLTTFNMCAQEFKNNSEYLCYGDEGVPAMYSRKHQWFLQGISLWWKYGGCKAEKPIVFTKVSGYLEWIQENIRP